MKNKISLFNNCIKTWQRVHINCASFKVCYEAEQISSSLLTKPAHAVQSYICTQTDMFRSSGGRQLAKCKASQFSVRVMSLSSSVFNARMGVCEFVCVCGLRVFFLSFLFFLKNCSQPTKKKQKKTLQTHRARRQSQSAETHLVITVMISPVEKDYWNGFGEWSLSAPLADIKHCR